MDVSGMLSNFLAKEIDKSILKELINIGFENEYPFMYRKARIDFLLYGTPVPNKLEMKEFYLKNVKM